MASLTVDADATSPSVDSTTIRPVDGVQGGEIAIAAGVNVDTGDGHDGIPQPNSEGELTLSGGLYEYCQVAPASADAELTLHIQGAVTIYTQYVFCPTRVFGIGYEHEPPSLTVHAGEPLWIDAAATDPAEQVKPHAHTSIIDLTPREVDADAEQRSLRGGSFTFKTTASGDIRVDLHANGAPGRDGGAGGRGGTVTVEVGGGFAVHAPSISASGSYGGSSRDEQHQRGGDGGSGGIIRVSAAECHGALNAVGGSGSWGSGSWFEGPAYPDGFPGGDGGSGGVIKVNADNSDVFTYAIGGGGGWGGTGWSVGQVDWDEGDIKGGDGGRGGNGGAGGYVQVTSMGQWYDYGGRGGHGGDGNDGSIRTIHGWNVPPIDSYGPGGDGGAGGSPGLSGSPPPRDTDPPILAPEPGPGGEPGDGDPPGEPGPTGDSTPVGTHPTGAGVTMPQRLDEPDDWTIMVYAMGDNDLEAPILAGLQFMEMVNLSGTNINLAIQIDRHVDYADQEVPSNASWGNWHDARRGWVTYDGDDTQYATCLKSVAGQSGGNDLNSAAAGALSDFVNWAMEQRPADHYALIIEDHGGGCEGVGLDESHTETAPGNWYQTGPLTDYDRIWPAELGRELDRIQGDLDLVTFAACRMQTLEVLAELYDKVDYVVGAQTYTYFRDRIISGTGSQMTYQRLLTSVVQQAASGAIAPQTLGEIMLGCYRPSSSGPVIRSLVRLERLDELVDSVEAFAEAMLDPASQVDWATVAQIVATSDAIGDPGGGAPSEQGQLRDLRSFMESLQLQQTQAGLDSQQLAAVQDVLNALTQVVVQTTDLGGVSIYLPRPGNGISMLYNPQAMHFLQETPPTRYLHAVRWYEVLFAIVSGVLNSRQATPGLYRPADSTFMLRNSNDGGVADTTFVYGPSAGWQPLVGDWDGDGVVTPGFYDPDQSRFYLRNSNTSGVADMVLDYGPAGSGWTPLVGDWDNDGADTIGLYDPDRSRFLLRNSNDSGVANWDFFYGLPRADWQPIVGNWDGVAGDTVGLYDPAGSVFLLRNSNRTGFADTVFAYGAALAGWQPLAGDFNMDGVDTIGLYVPDMSTFLLRNSNDSGFADAHFAYGAPGAGWKPLAGDWDGGVPIAEAISSPTLLDQITPRSFGSDELGYLLQANQVTKSVTQPPQRHKLAVAAVDALLALP
ncbi:MAG: hypothetical protein JXB62_19040 [Pirellulales bacterium]|nr:hypothetical protein [Pirellulales bacterium]